MFRVVDGIGSVVVPVELVDSVTTEVMFVEDEGVVELVLVEVVVVVVVVVVVLVVVVVVVASLHWTYSGQLQVSILESKYRPGGQDIRTGVRPTHL